MKDREEHFSGFVAVFAFIGTLIAAYFAAKFISEETSVLLGVLFFASVFLLSSWLLGMYAARAMVYTYEDQEREVRKMRKRSASKLR